MRRHYESLNYMDGAPGSTRFRFTRTNGADTGFIANAVGDNRREEVLTREQVEMLRDMLNEVLEDWK